MLQNTTKYNIFQAKVLIINSTKNSTVFFTTKHNKMNDSVLIVILL